MTQDQIAAMQADNARYREALHAIANALPWVRDTQPLIDRAKVALEPRA